MKYYITWYGAVIPEYYQQKIDAVNAFVSGLGHEFRLMHYDFTGTQQEAATAKDRLALSMACTTPDGVFLDADINLESLFEMIPNKPYFAICSGQPHISYFAVNDCCDFFINLQMEKERRGIQDVYKYTRKLLRDKLPYIYPIPAESFVHDFKMTHPTVTLGVEVNVYKL
jgi:hypothetical protein